MAQYPYQYAEDEFVTLSKATKGNRGGIDILIVGEGYTAREIADGSYISHARQAMDAFFAVAPFSDYKDYFNVYAAISVSPDSGIGFASRSSVSSQGKKVSKARFGTTYNGTTGFSCDYDALMDYATGAPTITSQRLTETLIIVIPNTSDYAGSCYLKESGATVAFCPRSNAPYPYDFAGMLRHNAVGHGFGRLADESVTYNSNISEFSGNSGLNSEQIRTGQSRGWYQNISLTPKRHEVPWAHLLSDPAYNGTVDVYEGGAGYSRGVYRSEMSSCMSSHIPYFNAISRETIVHRIKDLAGEKFSFEEFKKNDK